MAAQATPTDSNTPATPSPEEKLQSFWKNYQTPIVVLCAAVIIGISGRGLWQRLQTSKEADVEAEYAAATTPESLKSFAAAHEGHPLAGAADLQLADKAYAAEKYSDAISLYQTAIGALPASPVLSRAKLGLAMSQIQGGHQAEGESALHQLAADTSMPQPIRAEATYQLASLAIAAGHADEASKLCDQVISLDPPRADNPYSMPWWTEQAMRLKSTLPAAPAGPGQIKIGK